MVHDGFDVRGGNAAPRRPGSRKIWQAAPIAAHVAFQIVHRAESGMEPVQRTSRVSCRPEDQLLTQRSQMAKSRADSTVPESMAHSLDTAFHRLECMRFSSIFSVSHRQIHNLA